MNPVRYLRRRFRRRVQIEIQCAHGWFFPRTHFVGCPEHTYTCERCQLQIRVSWRRGPLDV